MPYKAQILKEVEMDKTAKERMRRYRNRKGVTKEGVTGEKTGGVTEDGIKDGIEMVPAVGILPERARFLTLSDNQVLDRAHPPKPDPTPGWKIQAMRNCNRAYQMRPLMGQCPLTEKLKAKFNRIALI